MAEEMPSSSKCKMLSSSLSFRIEISQKEMMNIHHIAFVHTVWVCICIVQIPDFTVCGHMYIKPHHSTTHNCHTHAPLTKALSCLRESHRDPRPPPVEVKQWRRCISYWKWGFSNVMLVFRGVQPGNFGVSWWMSWMFWSCLMDILEIWYFLMDIF